MRHALLHCAASPPAAGIKPPPAHTLSQIYTWNGMLARQQQAAALGGPDQAPQPSVHAGRRRCRSRQVPASSSCATALGQGVDIHHLVLARRIQQARGLAPANVVVRGPPPPVGPGRHDWLCQHCRAVRWDEQRSCAAGCEQAPCGGGSGGCNRHTHFCRSCRWRTGAPSRQHLLAASAQPALQPRSPTPRAHLAPQGL